MFYFDENATDGHPIVMECGESIRRLSIDKALDIVKELNDAIHHKEIKEE